MARVVLIMRSAVMVQSVPDCVIIVWSAFIETPATADLINIGLIKMFFSIFMPTLLEL